MTTPILMQMLFNRTSETMLAFIFIWALRDGPLSWRSVEDPTAYYGLGQLLKFITVIALFVVMVLIQHLYCFIRKSEKLVCPSLVPLIWSLGLTESMVFALMNYADGNDCFATDFLIYEQKESIYKHCIFRVIVLAALFVLQRDVKNACYRTITLLSFTFYFTYFIIRMFSNIAIEDYLGIYMKSYSSILSLGLFLALAYVTAAFGIYLASINRLF